LIYGNSSSRAIAAVSTDDFSGTLEMVGHKVTKCGNPAECSTVLANGHFDVVLADPTDAASLKGTNTHGIIPVAMKPSKEDLTKLKADYAVAFDASRDVLRLLPALDKAAKEKR
jgi:hypothetical protein